MNPDIKFPIFCKAGKYNAYKLLSPSRAVSVNNYGESSIQIEYYDYGNMITNGWDKYISGKMEIITEVEFMELKKIVQDKLDKI